MWSEISMTDDFSSKKWYIVKGMTKAGFKTRRELRTYAKEHNFKLKRSYYSTRTWYVKRSH